MTSSLVGSEMCIRDRMERGEREEVQSHWPETIKGVIKACWSFEPEARPVSYTHLTLPTICSV
eukprot:7242005-Prorocentrum_lima.AAC.1